MPLVWIEAAPLLNCSDLEKDVTAFMKGAKKKGKSEENDEQTAREMEYKADV